MEPCVLLNHFKSIVESKSRELELCE
jgi:hypothetical protein